MLPEQRATSYAHDPALHTVLVHVAEGDRPNLTGDVPARLLLDASSHLVGIDIAPDSPDRLVVMLGAHESVARTCGRSSRASSHCSASAAARAN